MNVVEDKCIGCGACVAVCPTSFEMSSNGKAKAMGESDCAEAGKSSCPVQAIE